MASQSAQGDPELSYGWQANSPTCKLSMTCRGFLGGVFARREALSGEILKILESLCAASIFGSNVVPRSRSLILTLRLLHRYHDAARHGDRRAAGQVTPPTRVSNSSRHRYRSICASSSSALLVFSATVRNRILPILTRRISSSVWTELSLGTTMVPLDQIRERGPVAPKLGCLPGHLR
jgi:hypothetical protein